MTLPALRLTPHGQALLTDILVLELRLAAIWREPFETYTATERAAWYQRRVEATVALEMMTRAALGRAEVV